MADAPTLARSFSIKFWSSSSRTSASCDDSGVVPSPSHQARVLFAAITGLIPPPHKSTKSSKQHSPFPPSKAEPAPPKLAGAQAPPRKVGRHEHADARPVPNITPKALNKLKKQLVDPKQQRKIVADLKRMELPSELLSPPFNDPPSKPLDASASAKYTSASATSSHAVTSKGFALPVLQPRPDELISPSPSLGNDTFGDGGDVDADETPPPTKEPIVAFTLIDIPTSVGAVGGLAGAKAGAFDLAADISGALVRSRQNGAVAPFDRVAVFVCHGVVLAATWLIPIALVPRPWDFPLPPPTSTPPPIIPSPGPLIPIPTANPPITAEIAA
ncbi:hypothetical protein MNV49_005249 [Pseudohyphozyma bogoriensis]|nr:hypothetical protein MNV49_005249 [Pseudohyphozyma bogoriensis]